jgi:hypothetical protein
MIKLLNISGETTFTLPAGHLLESVIVRQKSEGSIEGGIRIGTTQGAANILGSLPVRPIGASFVRLDSEVDFENERTLWLDAVHNWGGVSLDVFVITKDLNG